MTLRDKQTISPQQAHLQGLVLLVFALVAGAVIAYWEVSGSTSYPNAAVAPLANLGQSARQENIGMPHARAGLVATSSNQGQVLFGRYCDSCHPAGEEGIGASLRDAQFRQKFDMPDRIIKVVRDGGHDMPAFPPTLLPDDKLQEITEYVLKFPQEGQ